MGLLKKFLNDVFHQGLSAVNQSSFEHLSEEEIETHLGVARYGDFELTGAVRPSYDLKVKPVQGYRHDVYVDEESRSRVPVIMACASSDNLFDVFMNLIEPLGKTVDVVLESSHDTTTSGHVDLYREHIDMPVLKSILWDYEDLLLHDGCTGIAILNPHLPQEVQFDEHKLLIVYGSPQEQYEHILECHHVPHQNDIRFITEAEHVHSSCDDYYRRFDELRTRLGMDI